MWCVDIEKFKNNFIGRINLKKLIDVNMWLLCWNVRCLPPDRLNIKEGAAEERELKKDFLQ